MENGQAHALAVMKRSTAIQCEGRNTTKMGLHLDQDAKNADILENVEMGGIVQFLFLTENKTQVSHI